MRSASRHDGLGRPWSLALVLLALFGLSCARRNAADPSRAATPVAVKVIRVAGVRAVSDLVLPGRVRAKEEVTLSATVGARLTALPFAEGRAFRVGDVLARFESRESRLELAAAEAAVRATSVRLEEARRQEARIDSLSKARVVAPRDVDLASSDARIAEAAHEEARAKAAVLAFGMMLRAPFDGVVVRHAVDVGVILAPGAPVLVIRSSRGHDIEVAIPESQAGRLSERMPWFRTGDGPWRPARLSRLEGMTDYRSRTRTAYLEAADRAPVEPGAYAEVRFAAAGAPGEPGAATAGVTKTAPAPLESDGALRVPASSIVRRGGLTGVFVARDGRARLRWVRLGRPEGDVVEVLAGLWAGEEVIRDPAGIADGRAIEAVN